MARKSTAKTAAEFNNVIMTALVARLSVCPTPSQAKEIESCIKKWSDAIAKIAVERMSQTEFANVAKLIANGDKAVKTDYVQTKSVQKIIDLMRAVAQGLKPTDNNLRIVIEGMLQYDDHLTVKECCAVQSRNVQRDELSTGIRDNVSAKARYSVGTASSQAGQVRDVLRILNLATVQKGKKGDDATLNEYGRELLQPLFA